VKLDLISPFITLLTDVRSYEKRFSY